MSKESVQSDFGGFLNFTAVVSPQDVVIRVIQTLMQCNITPSWSPCTAGLFGSRGYYCLRRFQQPADRPLPEFWYWVLSVLLAGGVTAHSSQALTTMMIEIAAMQVSPSSEPRSGRFSGYSNPAPISIGPPNQRASK